MFCKCEFQAISLKGWHNTNNSAPYHSSLSGLVKQGINKFHEGTLSDKVFSSHTGLPHRQQLENHQLKCYLVANYLHTLADPSTKVLNKEQR